MCPKATLTPVLRALHQSALHPCSLTCLPILCAAGRARLQGPELQTTTSSSPGSLLAFLEGGEASEHRNTVPAGMHTVRTDSWGKE